MRAILDKLNERLKNLNKAYQACIKELKYEPQGNCSLLVNVIKDLKELQDAIQELRNSVGNLLDYIRLSLPSLNQDTPEFQRLRGSKMETKLTDQHSSEATRKIDQIINGMLVPALGVFNEYAREERGRGITGSQSNRAL
jgi:predicted  nucleic acid-binding Zn-ribbon protein